MEIWKDIPEYEGLYQVSTFGNVKSLNFNRTKKERILKPNIRYGYYSVQIFKKCERKTLLNHRLVAITFLPNYYGKSFIDHKNRNKLDNRLINLRWVTNQENQMNKTKKQHTSSQYIGVSWHRGTNKWMGQINNGRRIHLGYFENEYDAHLAYEAKKRELYPNL